MFDVIEHLFDPRPCSTAIARALAPGGTLVISTPNFDSASRLALGADWAVLSPLEHVYYFTEDSLRRLLTTTGFRERRFVRQHVTWGPQETINFRYTHEPRDGARAPPKPRSRPAACGWRGRCSARAAGRAAVLRAQAS